VHVISVAVFTANRLTDTDNNKDYTGKIRNPVQLNKPKNLSMPNSL